MKKKIVTMLMVAGLMAVNCVTSFAAMDEKLYLYANQEWRFALERVENAGNYSYALVNCESVYPAKENVGDTLTHIQVKIKNNELAIISRDAQVRVEENTGANRIYLKEGYISTNPLCFQFRGDTSAAAYAIIDYYTK